jgi:hypothetical protein
MAKEVDLGKPLSVDDREYLLQRNRWQEVEANEAEFGSDSEGGDQASPEDSDEEAESEGSESEGSEDDLDDKLKEELKAELDQREIRYPANALKADLIQLLRDSETAE